MRIKYKQIKEMDFDEVEEMARNDLKLNRYRLEEASQDQPEKFHDWYQIAEDAAAELKEFERATARVRSEVALKVRRMTKDQLNEKYGFTVLSEGAVKEIVELDASVVFRENKLKEVKRLYNKLKGFVDTARSRHSMIKVLTELYTSKYWSNTTTEGTRIGGRKFGKVGDRIEDKNEFKDDIDD